MFGISIGYHPNWNNINVPVQFNNIGDSFYITPDDLIKREEQHTRFECFIDVYDDDLDYIDLSIDDVERYVYHGPYDIRPQPDYSDIPF